jgi:hypothetical protein
MNSKVITTLKDVQHGHVMAAAGAGAAVLAFDAQVAVIAFTVPHHELVGQLVAVSGNAAPGEQVKTHEHQVNFSAVHRRAVRPAPAIKIWRHHFVGRSTIANGSGRIVGSLTVDTLQSSGNSGDGGVTLLQPAWILSFCVPGRIGGFPNGPTVRRGWEHLLSFHGVSPTRVNRHFAAHVPTDPTDPTRWEHVGKGISFQSHGHASQILAVTT